MYRVAHSYSRNDHIYRDFMKFSMKVKLHVCVCVCVQKMTAKISYYSEQIRRKKHLLEIEHTETTATQVTTRVLTLGY